MSRIRPGHRFGALALFAGLILATGASGASAQTAETTAGTVVSLDATGVVDPLLASYLSGAIQDAGDEGASAILITIDTPGGLLSATDDITQAILGSEVPVITYVAPAGAHAASAGTFVLLSGSVAAMAPGTNVGAAHPVGYTGIVMEEKVTNHSAAALVSIAEARGRNTEFAEAAVRDSLSISAEQALDDDVIDLIAPDVETLLAEVDGMTVPVASGTVVLDTAGARVETVGMNAFLGFFHSLLGPDLAFVFFWLGLTLLILEIFVPGGIIGTLGFVLLGLALFGFGMLPVALIGMGLLVASVVFFILEIKSPGIGAAGIAGVVCLVLGGLSLYDRSLPVARVSLPVIIVMGIVVTLFFAVAIQAAMKLRNVPVHEPIELVGSEAVVIRSLDPSGTVRVRSEEWSATSDRNAEVGDAVRVTSVDGFMLHVEPVGEPTEFRQEAEDAPGH